MDIFEKEFKNKAIISWNTYLFRGTDVVDVIKKCEELNIKILGVDSFEIYENKIKPIMEGILDCTTDGNKEGSWSEAIHFVQEMQSQMQNQVLVFEIIYDL